VAQAAENLPSKYEILSSNSSIAKKEYFPLRFELPRNGITCFKTVEPFTGIEKKKILTEHFKSLEAIHEGNKRGI
jgi:hypothetical protein